ncbi:Crp/Fnr family transcriptional regulator [Ruegeria atlantica]|uniref:Cyclic AMP receptor-like protein n=1 Tax=Ruegeria atlantica TaxID=81569 RepID=A0A0P1ERU5_9RHOB|nr:Crp/Fnr family transcriptional regulator [Ruegeria atlantica]CUH43414.1 Cyclic AMP receptor-like protein [Ruegeria atlantica]
MQKPSRTKEIQALVAASPWLRAIDARLANGLVNSGRSVSVESGAGIYALSDQDQSVFAVVSGAVGIQLDDGQSGIVLGHVFGPGAWFGEAAAITGLPRQIGAIALTDCQLFRVPYEALIQLEQDDQPIWRALGALAVTNGALAIRVARDLMLADSKLRSLTILTRISDAFAPTRAIPLTQQHLAEICRLSRSAFAKLVAELEADGLVQRKYGSLVVVPQ